MTFQDLYTEALYFYNRCRKSVAASPIELQFEFTELPLSEQLYYVNLMARSAVEAHLIKHGLTEEQHALGRAYLDGCIRSWNSATYDQLPFEVQCIEVSYGLTKLNHPYYYHTALAVLNA